MRDQVREYFSHFGNYGRNFCRHILLLDLKLLNKVPSDFPILRWTCTEGNSDYAFLLLDSKLLTKSAIICR
jgi:hypothetical protein